MAIYLEWFYGSYKIRQIVVWWVGTKVSEESFFLKLEAVYFTETILSIYQSACFS
jgi:hypothetical protein